MCMLRRECFENAEKLATHQQNVHGEDIEIAYPHDSPNNVAACFNMCAVQPGCSCTGSALCS